MTKFFKKSEDGTYEEVEAFTSQQVEDAVRKRVDKVNEKYSDYEDLKTTLGDKDKELDSLKESKTGLEKQLSEKDTEIDQIKLGAVRTTVRAKHGLSEDFDQFLTGKDEEEIEKQAELLKGSGNGEGVHFNKDTKKPPVEDPSAAAAKSIFGPKSD